MFNRCFFFFHLQSKKSCLRRTACRESAAIRMGWRRRNSTTRPSLASSTPRHRVPGAALAAMCWTTDLPKSFAWCAATGRPVTITMRSHAKVARGFSGGASPKTRCTSASTATTAKSTCTWGGSARSAGWKNAWPSAWGLNVSAIHYFVCL